mgnify:CR=1 FL=1
MHALLQVVVFSLFQPHIELPLLLLHGYVSLFLKLFPSNKAANVDVKTSLPCKSHKSILWASPQGRQPNTDCLPPPYSFPTKHIRTSCLGNTILVIERLLTLLD